MKVFTKNNFSSLMITSAVVTSLSFVLIASVSAFHRLLLKPAEGEIVLLDEDGQPYYPIIKTDEAVLDSAPSSPETEPEKPGSDDSEKEKEPMALSWNRFGFVDFVGTMAMLLVTKKIWAYFLFTWGS